MRNAIAAMVLFAGAAAGQALLTPDAFLKDWEISREFTVEVATAMPAEHYNFKPTPEQMAFGGQMIHIAMSLFYRFAQLRGEKPPYEKPPEPVNKETIIRLVREAYDYAIESIRNTSPEQLNRSLKVDWRGRPTASGSDMVLNMLVHAAHHRAQCEVYLRLKGIKPPQYTF